MAAEQKRSVCENRPGSRQDKSAVKWRALRPSVSPRRAEDAGTVAQRWGRQSLSAAEDFAGNATDHIKHDPVRAAAISFVIGLGLGALVAWGSTRHQSD